MAFKDPRNLAEQLVGGNKKPLTIANPQAAVTGGEGGITTTRLKDPIRGSTFGPNGTFPHFAYGYFRGNYGPGAKTGTPEQEKWAAENSDLIKRYQDFRNGLDSALSEYYDSKGFKTKLLDYYLSDDDRDAAAFQNETLDDFLTKYPYEKEDIFKGLLRYYDKDHLNIGEGYGLQRQDLIDYIKAKQEPQDSAYSLENNPLYWAERVYDAVDSGEADYGPDEIALAKQILRKWGGI